MASTYTLEVEQSNINAPFIDGDERPDDPLYLPSTYTGTSFSVDLEFTLTEFSEETPPEGQMVTIEDISSSLLGSYGGISFTDLVPSDPAKKKIRVSGTVTGSSVGGGEFYQFVLDQVGYPIITTTPQQIPNDFLAITRWTIPPVTVELLAQIYKFSADYFDISSGDTLTFDLFMSQYLYWNWIPALAAFE